MAKINLGLDVVRKRDDGYHEVRMIMQTIQMYDQLDMAESSRPGIRLATNLAYLPNNENNLVYRAANMLMEEFHIKKGLDIRLRKMIPVAAGMAGGSSDAAAAFIGVNRIFRLGLSMDELMQRAVKVGADVPYCCLLYTSIDKILQEKGIKTHRAYVGNYFTSLEMSGATLTVMKLDEELKELIDMPAYSMGLKQN